MYERTPLSRGEGLDPNPLGMGECLEHRYKPITCNKEMSMFSSLNVSLFRLLIEYGVSALGVLFYQLY